MKLKELILGHGLKHLILDLGHAHQRDLVSGRRLDSDFLRLLLVIWNISSVATLSICISSAIALARESSASIGS